MAHEQHGPLDTLWRPTTLIWILIAGEALSLVLAAAPGMHGDRLVYFGLTSLMVQWIVLLTVGALYLLRRRLTPAPAQRIAWLTLVLLMLSTWLVGGLAWSVLRSMGLPLGDWWRFFSQISTIALTMGLAGLATFQNHWRSRQLAIRAKQSELDTLRARIRPHFLFNTLNTGIALVHGRPEEAERLLLDLADLFRAALAGPAEVTLEEELALARRYLEIESLRFGERLETRWQVSATTAELQAAMLPALSVQPLVENAIKHGIEPDNCGGRISIDVDCSGTFATVTVRNPVPAGSRGNGRGHGIGLAAVRARIEAMDNGGVLETSSGADGFTATIKIRKHATS
ncbi:sensor histidine kinase [Luteimonas changyuni]|uniref:sensor histidine kinase n=1 Tax=Luteimonas sp. MJ145 TaxID=3129234 RepID=UPI0031BB23DA